MITTTVDSKPLLIMTWVTYNNKKLDNYDDTNDHDNDIDDDDDDISIQ